MPKKRDSNLAVEMSWFVESVEEWHRLSRFLVGEPDEQIVVGRFKTRISHIHLVPIPGVELGYAGVGVSSLESSSEHIQISMSDIAAFSSNFAKWDFHVVDAGAGAVIASMIRVAASVHKHVGVKSVWLLMEGNFGRGGTDALVLHSDWAEALGLAGESRDFRLKQVSWSEVHAFDAEAAVRALYDRRLKATEAGPRS
jgi:hypothetical protein